MKKALLYVLVGAITTVVSGTGSYLLTAKKGEEYAAAMAAQQQNQNKDNTWGDNHTDDDTTDSAFTKMLKNVLNYNDFTVGKNSYVGFKAASLMESMFKMNIGDTEFNFLDSSSPKIQGNLGLSYDGQSSNVQVNYDSSSAIYFTYMGGKFSVGVNADYSGIFDVVNAVSKFVPAPSVPETSNLGNIDIGALLRKIEKIVKVGDGTDTVSIDGTDQKAFHVLYDALTVDGITVSNIAVYLTHDDDNNLTGIYTESGTPLTITKGGQSFELELHMPLTMAKNSSVYNGLSDSEKSSFTSVDKLTTSLFTTLGTYAKNSNFNADVKIGLSSDETAPLALASHTINLGIAGDFSSVAAVEDFATKGTYQLKLSDEVKGYGKQSFSALYSKETTYLDFGDSFKGKVENSAIEDIIGYASDLTEDREVSDTSDTVNKILSVLKNFNMVEDGKIVLPASLMDQEYGLSVEKKEEGDLLNSISFQINTKAFGLGDGNVKIAFSTDTDGNFKSVSISGLAYKGYFLTAEISFNEFTDATIGSVDTASYKSLNRIAPVFASVSELVKAKQFSLGYSVNTVYDGETDKTYSLSGSIDGDLTKLNTSKSLFTEQDLGSYHLFANLSSSGTSSPVSKSFDAKFLNQNLYFEYGGLSSFKNKISGSTIEKAIGLMDDKSESTTISDSMDTINSILDGINNSEYLSDDFKKLVDEVKNGYLGGEFQSFLSVSAEDSDTGAFRVELNLPLVFSNKIEMLSKLKKVTLTLDATSEKFTALNAVLGYDNVSSTITMNLLDFDSSKFALDGEESSYVLLDHPVASFLNLPSQLQKFDLAIEGSVKKVSGADEKTLVTVKGKNSFLTEDSKTDGDGYMTLKDEAGNLHRLEYTYIPDDGTNSSYAGTTVEYNDHMHILASDRSVVRIFDEASKIPSTKVMTTAMKYLQSSADSVAVPEIIKDGDLSPILNAAAFSDGEVTDSKLTVRVSPKVFLDAASIEADAVKDDTSVVLTFTYDPEKDSLSSASIAMNDLAGYNADFTLSLKDYAGSGYTTDTTSSTEHKYRKNDAVTVYTSVATVDEKEVSTDHAFDVLLYSAADKNRFVSFDNVANLLQMGINTTDESYYYLTGKISIGASVGSDITMDAFILRAHAEIEIDDGEVKAYVALSNNGSTDITDEGFFASEFFLSTSRDEIYGLKTVNPEGGENYSSSLVKVASSELSKNAVYYLMEYALNFRTVLGTGVGGKAIGNLALANVYSALGLGTEKTEETKDADGSAAEGTSESSDSSSDSLFNFALTDDYSQIFAGAVSDTTARYMGLDLDLSKIADFSGDVGDQLSLGHLLINAYYEDEDVESAKLSSIEIKGRSEDSNGDLYKKEIGNFGGLVSLNVAVHLDNHTDVSDKMTRYNEFMNWYSSSEEAQNLGDFEVTGYSYSKMLGVLTDVTVNNNGNVLTYRAGDANTADKAYYFQGN